MAQIYRRPRRVYTGRMIFSALLLATAQSAPATADTVAHGQVASNAGAYESPEPIGGDIAWISRIEYPTEARRRGEEGRVLLKLSIDAKGVPTDCVIVASSGSSILDSATCAGAKRFARFRPAMQDGKPIAATYEPRAVNWKLDDAPVAAPTLALDDAPRVMTDSLLDVSIDAAGAVTGCRIVRVMPANGGACVQFPVGKRLLMPLTKGGHPTSAHLRVATSMTLSVDSPKEP